MERGSRTGDVVRRERMDPMSGVFDNPKAYEKADTDSGPWVLVTPVSQIAARPVEWLWNGRIPRGMLSMVEGNPDVGKSTVLLDIAARVTRGWKMPDKSGGGDPRAVVLLSAEDDPAKVIRPRLEAGGADLERVVLISIQGKGDGREPVISDADVALIEQAIVDEKAALLIVDPLVAYLPDGVDSNSDHSVRRALVRLKGLAERTDCAVVCVRHWRKASTDNALYRGSGSIGFIAASRSGLVVGRDPEDESGKRRVLASSKMNLAPLPPSLSFCLEVKLDATFPHVKWGEVSKHSASALTSPESEKDRSAVDDAANFLEERLADGWVPVKVIMKEGKEQGISEPSIRRAKKRLKLRKDHLGKPGDEDQLWVWGLALDALEGDQAAQYDLSIQELIMLASGPTVSPSKDRPTPKVVKVEDVVTIFDGEVQP